MKYTVQFATHRFCTFEIEADSLNEANTILLNALEGDDNLIDICENEGDFDYDYEVQVGGCDYPALVLPAKD